MKNTYLNVVNKLLLRKGLLEHSSGVIINFSIINVANSIQVTGKYFAEKGKLFRE